MPLACLNRDKKLQLSPQQFALQRSVICDWLLIAFDNLVPMQGLEEVAVSTGFGAQENSKTVERANVEVVSALLHVHIYHESHYNSAI